jgi:hypothetical protein
MNDYEVSKYMHKDHKAIKLPPMKKFMRAKDTDPG